MSARDHVRMRDGGEEFLCERCGDSYRMRLPCNLDVVVAAARAYGRVHQRCKPRAADAGRRRASEKVPP